MVYECMFPPGRGCGAPAPRCRRDGKVAARKRRGVRRARRARRAPATIDTPLSPWRLLPAGGRRLALVAVGQDGETTTALTGVTAIRGANPPLFRRQPLLAGAPNLAITTLGEARAARGPGKPDEPV